MCLLGFFAVGYTILERTKPIYTNTGYIGKLYKKHHASLATVLNPEKEFSASNNLTTKILPIDGGGSSGDSSSTNTSGNGIVQQHSHGQQGSGVEQQEEGKGGESIHHENRELTV